MGDEVDPKLGKGERDEVFLDCHLLQVSPLPQSILQVARCHDAQTLEVIEQVRNITITMHSEPLHVACLRPQARL